MPSEGRCRRHARGRHRLRAARQRLVRRIRDQRDHRRDRSAGVDGQQDAAHDARSRRFDLEVGFVGLDFEEDLALLDALALLLVPRDEPAFVHGQTKLGEDDAGHAHARIPFIRRQAPWRRERCPRPAARPSSRGAARTGSASRDRRDGVAARRDRRRPPRQRSRRSRPRTHPA